MVGGLLVAVLVAMMVQVMLGGNKSNAKVVQTFERIEILVANEEMTAGDELSLKNMKWQSWPKDALFEGVVERKGAQQATTDALDGVLRADVAKGQPVTKNVVLDAEQGSFVSAKLEPGMRAFSINVSAASMVSGFVQPGDFVDVILTYEVDFDIDEDQNPGLEEYVRQHIDEFAVETILQNVKVIGIDQKAKRKDDDKAKVGRTVTLEVGLREAESLMLAAEIGDLGLALRRLGDKDIVSQDEPLVTDVRMTGIQRDLQRRLSETAKANPAPNYNAGTAQINEYVRVYSGSSVQAITVAR